jgi:hypothetical protein
MYSASVLDRVDRFLLDTAPADCQAEERQAVPVNILYMMTSGGRQAGGKGRLLTQFPGAAVALSISLDHLKLLQQRPISSNKMSDKVYVQRYKTRAALIIHSFKITVLPGDGIGTSKSTHLTPILCSNLRCPIARLHADPQAPRSPRRPSACSKLS